MSEIDATLNQLQADHQVLYQKLRAYHWTVKGPMFFQLHLKFEELYDQAALQVDELAERALALGAPPVPTLAAALELARLKEAEGGLDAAGMVRDLAQDLGHLVEWLRAAGQAAGDAGDNATLNLLEGLADVHEKDAWMLRAFLEA